jgi:hypothetical protein
LRITQRELCQRFRITPARLRTMITRYSPPALGLQ